MLTYRQHGEKVITQMKKEYCKDCVCLIEGNNEKWVCDEKGVEISKIKRCPETGELEEEEENHVRY